MALEVLEQLAHDVERWVWSGALAAQGDGRLQAHENTLATLGAKVPALAKVAQLATALRSAPAAEAPAALLQLDLAVQQLRAAQLELAAPEGPLGPLPEYEMGAFEPVPARALYAFFDATESRKRPSDGVELALRTLPFQRDPRTWEALVGGLDHPYLCQGVVPALSAMGAKLLPTLERKVKLKGKDGDAARLRIIGAIRKEEGAALYRQALEKGSPAVQLAALECLQYVSREELEQRALHAAEAVAHRDDGYRFVPALLLAGSDRALERVVDALAAAPDVVATPLLNALSPEQAERLIRIARARSGATPERELPLVATDYFAEWLLRTGRPEAPEVLLDLLSFPNLQVRSASAAKLIKLSDPPGLEAIVRIGLEENILHTRMAEALLALGPAATFERMHPFLARYLPPEPDASVTSAQPTAPAPGGFFRKLGSFFGGQAASSATAVSADDLTPVKRPVGVHEFDQRLQVVLGKIGPDADPRWVPALIRTIHVHPEAAIPALGQLGDRRAVPILLEIAQRDDRGSTPQALAFNALAALKAREALPLMLDWIRHNLEARTIGSVIKAVGELGDPSAIPALRAISEAPGTSSFLQQYIGATLQRLENSR